MPPGILLFTGAPESKSLNWKDSSLLDHFSKPFSRFAGLRGPQNDSSMQDLTSSLQPAWRSIPLERKHLATGHSQSYAWQKEYQGAEFFTADSFVEEMSQPSPKESQESIDQVLSQFYEKSYAIHEDIASSQLAAASDFSSSLHSNASFGTTNSLYDSQSASFSGKKDVPVAGHLSNLMDVPNAVYLDSIRPQTMTVNLIVGIISIPPPRAIRTRRGANVGLIEVLVGDETKSGFGINFWLPSSQNIISDLKDSLEKLRPQDVVLMRNVALSSFRGKVHGQSLRKEMTKVHLLYRNRIDRSDLGGCYNSVDLAVGGNAQVDKARRVREWVLRFVGGGIGAGAARQVKGRAEVIKETLPPDTQ